MISTAIFRIKNKKKERQTETHQNSIKTSGGAERRKPKEIEKDNTLEMDSPY